MLFLGRLIPPPLKAVPTAVCPAVHWGGCICLFSECGNYKVIESVLGEKLQPEEGELTETLMLTEKLR
jgi:hypothetical protein